MGAKIYIEEPNRLTELFEWAKDDPAPEEIYEVLDTEAPNLPPGTVLRCPPAPIYNTPQSGDTPTYSGNFVTWVGFPNCPLFRYGVLTGWSDASLWQYLALDRRTLGSLQVVLEGRIRRVREVPGYVFERPTSEIVFRYSEPETVLPAQAMAARRQIDGARGTSGLDWYNWLKLMLRRGRREELFQDGSPLNWRHYLACIAEPLLLDTRTGRRELRRDLLVRL